MMASDEKFEDFKKLRNPLIKLLERNKKPESTVQGGGADKEEEEEEEMVIWRRRKGKMIVEEDEEETAPGTDEAEVYVEEMNTHVPVSLLLYIFEDEPRSQEGLEDIRMIDEMEITPETVESVPVETRHISGGVTNVEEKNREQQAPVGQDDHNANDGDDDDEDEDDEAEDEEPRSPESATSAVAPKAWEQGTIRSRTGVQGKCKPTPLKSESSDEIRF